MRLRASFFFLALFTLSASADDEYRTFTGKDGRTIEARIESADESTVDIRRSDGARFTIPKDRLSEKDIEFIDRWIVAEAVGDDRVFKIKARRRDDNERESESSSTITEFRDGFYDVHLENRTGMDLTGLEFWYIMRVERTAQGKQEDRKSEIWKSGTEKNLSINDREEKEFETNRIELVETNLKPGWFYIEGGPGKARDKMDGLYLAVFHEGEVVREYALPSGILEDGREKMKTER